MDKLKKLLAVPVCMAMALALLPGVVMAETYVTTADGLEYKVYDDHVEITDYSGSAPEVVIPAALEGKPVTGIEAGAFQACTSLTSVTIPDASIGYSAFPAVTASPMYITAAARETETKIVMGYYNDSLRSATKHYNSVGPSQIKVTVNGAPIAFDVPPIAIEGTTMLPVRLALEPLGAEFVWNGENQTVTITAKGKTVVLTMDSDVAYVDGVAKTMARPVMVTDGRTLIPSASSLKH